MRPFLLHKAAPCLAEPDDFLAGSRNIRARTLKIPIDCSAHGAGHLLSIGALAERCLVMTVGHEPHLDQNGGNICRFQHDERRMTRRVTQQADTG